MTIGERHATAKKLFLELCDLPAEDRVRKLDEECAGDNEMRREVEALLAVDGESKSSGPGLDPSLIIGPYRLLQKVGEGGMGEVWEAEQQQPVRRRVALKLIKWGMDTKQVLARFESERQALVLMNHPNIAKAYEAGSSDEGRPYFAMEFVKGVSITMYCDANRLDTRQRLELFRRVCDGVQHAHQKGVIHRDIKPSNILVAIEDGIPVPKIIDFGVAKATSQRLTERTLFTELGQWIGTPEYMSPEQAELTSLDVDTRSDVYSLGVVLYELLVGAQPFDAEELRTAGFDEMRRRIREDEPPRPSTRVSSLGDASQLAAERRRTDRQGLVRTLRGDLDWIVMKALEKDRTRRYGSPSSMAADVGRYMRDEPVEAGPPTTAYRLRKFVSRHRVGVTAAVVIVLALVAGVIGTTIGVVRAQREAEAARKAAEVLTGVFGTLDPENPMGRALTTRQVLDVGTERVDVELEGVPMLQARLLETLGQAYLNLGYFDESLPLLERSLEIQEHEHGGESPEVASTLTIIGWTQYWLADFRASRESFERSLGIRERSPTSTDAEIAKGLADLAFLEWRSGRYPVSDELFGRAVTLVSGAATVDGLVASDVYYKRALLWLNLGRYAEAQEILQPALELRREALGDGHSGVGWVYHLLSVSHAGLGDSQAAERLARQALQVFEEQLGAEHWSVAFPITVLANIRRWNENYDAAGPLYRRGLEIRRSTLPADHPDQCYSLIPYGEYLLETGDIDGARELFEEAVRITEKTLGDEHSETAGSRAHMSIISWLEGDFEAALAGFRESYEVHRRNLPDGHPGFARNLFFQAASLAGLGRTEEAIECLREVVRMNRFSPSMIEHTGMEPLRGLPEYEALVEEVRSRS